jgi:hypothetical protein
VEIGQHYVKLLPGLQDLDALGSVSGTRHLKAFSFENERQGKATLASSSTINTERVSHVCKDNKSPWPFIAKTIHRNQNLTADYADESGLQRHIGGKGANGRLH